MQDHQNSLQQSEVMHKRKTVQVLQSALNHVLHKLNLSAKLSSNTVEDLVSEYATCMSAVIGKTEDNLVNQLGQIWQAANDTFGFDPSTHKLARQDSIKWLNQRH